MATHAKLDLYKEFRSEYVTPKQPVFVAVGPAQYLSITGQGKPGGESFKQHIGALYAAAYTLKMAEKMAGHDYKVCHLEGQWWADKACDGQSLQAEAFEWKLLIRVPEFITQKDLDAAIRSVMAKRKSALASQVKLEAIAEGRCVQILHIGPYAQEETSVDKMRQMAEQNGVHLRGPHHEIYLSDPNRVPKERLRTILRYPVD